MTAPQGVVERDERQDSVHRELRTYRRLVLIARAIDVRPVAWDLHRRAVAQPDDEVNDVPDVYRGRLGALLDVVLINLRDLPPSLSVLRLMALPQSARQARENI